jgi:DNA-binding beta-propeller fold protein YncE
MRCKAGILGANRPKGWDILSAAYQARFALGNEPKDLFLSPNGDKLFTVAGSEVREHGLSTAWDISSTSFTSSLSTATEDNACDGVFISSDGANLFVCGSGAGLTGYGPGVHQYSLPYPFSLLSATHVRSLSINAQQAQPRAVFFRDNGLSMYVAGSSDDRVHEYTLSTAWNIATASYSRLKVLTEVTTPVGLWFRPNGQSMYVVDAFNDDITEYSLSTAWNVQTAAYVRERSVSSEGTSPAGLFIDADGFRMFVADQTGEEINQYKMN